MKSTEITRRDVLKLMALGLTGVALDAAPGTLPVLAQSGSPTTAYADDVALTMDEIAQVRTANLRLAMTMDQMVSDYSQVIVSTARAVAADYGITLTVLDPHGDAGVQRVSMGQLVDQGMDGIFTLPLSLTTLAVSLSRANQAGIPVVMMGGRPDSGQLAALLNSTNYLGCYQATSALIRAVGGGGKVAVVSSGRDLTAYREGERGVIQALADAPMEFAGLVAAGNEDEAATATAALLSAHPDLAGIFATWGDALDGVLDALDAAGSDVKVAGFSAEVEGFRAFDAGDERLIALSVERGTVVGRAIIDSLCKAILKQPLPAEVLMPTLLVTTTNYRTRWSEIYPGRAAPWEPELTTTPAAS